VIKISATFAWKEYNTVSVTESTPTNLNFGSTDATDLVALTYPITAGSNAYEKWIKFDFSGTFTSISNLQFWKSVGTYVSEEAIKWKGNNQTVFATPTVSDSSVATADVPVADPGTANVSIGGSLAGTLSAAGKSDFVVLQSQIGASAAAGPTNTKTFTIQYDEI